jgi:Protein of unknown function (DUF4232)
MRRCVVLLLFCALGAAACGGSSASSSSSSTGAAAPTTSTAPTTTTATTSAGPSTSSQTTSRSPTTTPTGGARACRGIDLALSYLGQQGATGHGELGFALRNHTAEPCHTYGYAGVLFLDRAGRPLPTDSTRTTHDFFGTLPARVLVVGPGRRVSFRLGVTHGAAGTQNCTTARGLQVIAPDDTDTLRVRIPGGAYECRTVTISPLAAGGSAYP